ncbi:unnamed protein product [Rotaria sp. Silwood2]|nr:unnamed protein product [Rotaria sp. Silwood2]CAF2725561.1 unnamed protein product [Rotaria sp. Silwood2]CAF3144991.1 unnamed protein product [Rotaria sp. Silwood2]CAF4606138.1 unnamed protein product [Rotaria sp. Silwood2]CAF4629942.1 unnamed protein product [Rotaria sp. Silwood2]
MKLHPIFFEPEIHSSIFLIGNLICSIIIRLIIHSWPLTTFWSCFYIIIVFLINHSLASGRYYLPTKNIRNKTVIVTGAATGIGRVCAIRFAKLGARVIIGVRGEERAERIAKELCKESNGGTVIGYDLDLSSLANVKRFAEKIERVDILLNNAGALQKTYSVTVDGIEKQFGTNHIGHFYLTQLLLPLLTDGRVINVSSLVHHIVPKTGIDYKFSKLKNKYSTSEAYAISKLAQIYHASELTRRCGIKAYSLHPGTIINTNLNQSKNFIEQIILQLISVVGKTVEQGSMTSLYCALSDDAKPGYFHSNCQVRKPSQLALDNHRAEECWNESEKLINEKIK